MADYILLAMTDNTSEGQSFRRTLGSSSIFGRRTSKSNTNTKTNENTGITTAHIRIIPSIENPSRSLIFSIIERDLEAGRIIKIGRFTDRSSVQNHISFKSKVVSRAHCEIWLNNEGKILLKDTKSSSGTFVNHVRLSPANTESRAIEIKDNDLVQLGVDYQGGYEEMYRSVRMRFEINRPQQPKPVSYSMSVFNNLRQLATMAQPIQQPNSNLQIEECCICLYALAPFQALFVAPCSHSYHFKCIRPLLDSYPGFQCPICRTYSDLEASVAIEAEEVIEKYGLKKEEQPEVPIEQPLSTTFVASTSSLSGIISSPTTLDISHIDQEGDHRATIIMDDNNNVIQGSGSRTTNANNNNLVEKIKMTFSNEKKFSSIQLKKRSLSNSSDEDNVERSDSIYHSSSSSIQPILSRQSTHHHALNGILEESTTQ